MPAACGEGKRQDGDFKPLDVAVDMCQAARRPRSPVCPPPRAGLDAGRRRAAAAEARGLNGRARRCLRCRGAEIAEKRARSRHFSAARHFSALV